MPRLACLMLVTSYYLLQSQVNASEQDRVELSYSTKGLPDPLRVALSDTPDLHNSIDSIAIGSEDQRGFKKIQRQGPSYTRWPWAWLWSCGQGAAIPLRWRFIRCDGKRGKTAQTDSSGSNSDDDLSKRETPFKKVRFHSWGGKRGKNEDGANYDQRDPDLPRDHNEIGPGDGEDYQDIAKRGEPNPQVVLRVPFNAWGGKRDEPMKKVRFHSWGGKRTPELISVPRRLSPKVPFNAWGGKRSHHLLAGIGPSTDYDLMD